MACIAIFVADIAQANNKVLHAACLISLLFGSCSSGTTGSTGELYGAHNGVLGVYELKTFDVDVAYGERFAKSEVVYVDHQTLGDGGVECTHFEFLHRERELTTGFHTFGVAFELHGHFHNDGLAVVDLKEVHVEDGVFNGVELEVFENGHTFVAVDIKLYSEDIGSVDQLAHCVVGNNEVGGDKTFAIADFYDFLAGFECAGERKLDNGAAVEYYGDKTLFTKGFCCLFAQICAGLGCKFK